MLLSDRVFISDHIHSYREKGVPVIKQSLVPRGKVMIRAGAFIGINAVIMPGVTIGRNAVVGASSVVYQDVPDFSVAAGNPARLVKKYYADTDTWITLEPLATHRHTPSDGLRPESTT